VSPGVALDGRKLQPGTNALHFRVRPLKCGLYCIKGVQARLGHLRLALPLVQSDDETQAAATAGAKQPSRGGADGIGIGTEFYCTAVFSYQSAHEAPQCSARCTGDALATADVTVSASNVS